MVRSCLLWPRIDSSRTFPLPLLAPPQISRNRPVAELRENVVGGYQLVVGHAMLQEIRAASPGNERGDERIRVQHDSQETRA